MPRCCASRWRCVFVRCGPFPNCDHCMRTWTSIPACKQTYTLAGSVHELKVFDVVEGSVAHTNGLRDGDRVLAVDGEFIAKKPAYEAVRPCVVVALFFASSLLRSSLRSRSRNTLPTSDCVIWLLLCVCTSISVTAVRQRPPHFHHDRAAAGVSAIAPSRTLPCVRSERAIVNSNNDTTTTRNERISCVQKLRRY